MNVFKYPQLVLLLITVMMSCKKGFLDVTDNSQLTRQSRVVDLESMESFSNGLYAMLSKRSGLMDGLSVAYADLVADNLKPRDFPGLLMIYRWSQQKDDGSAVNTSSLNENGIWREGYLVIRACSFVIENIDRYRDENTGKADEIKGKAYAIRAYAHFVLVNVFAQHYTYSENAVHIGIPFINTSDITKPYSRQSVAEVYAGIISDLNNSIQYLPSEAKDIRLMNKLAARALLARVYLYMEDYQSALRLAKEVASEVPLMTIQQGYPDGIFNNMRPGETEVLFQATPGTTISSFFLGTYLRGTNLSYNATSDIASILQKEMNDVRSKWVTDSLDQWYVTKFPVRATGVPALRSLAEADYYHPVIRSSEMYLTVAECFAKLGDEQSARSYLDAIRKRADSSLPPSTAAGQKLLDVIYEERRKELCFEGLRMYDLQRWKIGVNRIDVLPGTPQKLPYPNVYAIAPIPLLDVQLGGLPQNSGY